MKISDIRWGWAFGGMVLAMVAQIAAAIGWVAFYSHVIHPGEAPAFYQRYAEAASPWVSVIAGFPVFYFVCRWVGSRVRAGAWPTAMALFGLYVLLDLALILSAGPLPARLVPFLVASYPLKFLACHIAGRRAIAKRIAGPA